MNYLTKYFLNDKKFWLKFLIVGSASLIVIDLLSYMFRPPGYLNLWSIKIFLLIGIPITIRLLYKNFHNLNKIKKVESEAPIFEENRRQEILDIIKTDSEFATHCYECIHFNDESKACGRDRVFEKVKEISIGLREYCLYWESVHIKKDNLSR